MGLVHAVFFSLKDRSAEAAERLIAACRHDLAALPGIVHFSVGTRAEQYQRPVNDAEFDVALVVAFATVEHHDLYQTAAEHKRFIAEQSGNWAKVRVFDAEST